MSSWTDKHSHERIEVPREVGSRENGGSRRAGSAATIEAQRLRSRRGSGLPMPVPGVNLAPKNRSYVDVGFLASSARKGAYQFTSKSAAETAGSRRQGEQKAMPGFSWVRWPSRRQPGCRRG